MKYWYVIAMLLSVMAASSARAAEARPNIVLIMADDMGYECIAANSGQSYTTPNLDKLAATGMRFEHCYSQPLCTPSRVQLMTGMYNSRNYIQFGLLEPGSYTFGNLLHDAGFATCVVGKWQLRGGLGAPNRFGFDEYCLWQLNRRPNRYPNPGLEINGRRVDFTSGEYGPDVVSEYACEFIERHAGGDRPFFLYYPMILPHSPFEPTPDSPEWDPAARRGDTAESGNGPDDQQFFDDMVRYVDKIVGKVVAKLEEHDLRENTLVLFTGDNGTTRGITSRFNGRDWIGGKGRMTDSGTRVGLIANWQGKIPAQQVNSDLIDFSDVLPTLAAAAGAKLPEEHSIDGRSFYPQLKGKAGNPREWIYCWYFRDGKPVGGGPGHTAGESARTHRYKLYLNGGFYDVQDDFYEQHPLRVDELTPEQEAIRTRLHAVIQQHTRDRFYGD
ncbi:MAG: sulfatase-like hydrolase/transferase [Pirellulales bacterium]